VAIDPYKKKSGVVRLERVIPIFDGVGYSRPRFEGEAETWQGFFMNACILETNQLAQKSQLF
jgi:hypothetical protein